MYKLSRKLGLIFHCVHLFVDRNSPDFGKNEEKSSIIINCNQLI